MFLSCLFYADKTTYDDLGDPIHECQYCGALLWYEERINNLSRMDNICFSLCCSNGKIVLPKPCDPPDILYRLLHNQDPRSKHFLQNTRPYNSCFSLTSLGGKIDQTINNGNAPSVFRLNGQNYHFMGSLLPPDGSRPKFAQLYIYDTQNEDSNRISVVRYISTYI